MSKLHIYNLCLEAISRERVTLEKKYPQGAVVGVYDDAARRVRIVPFKSLDAARAYQKKALDRPGESPVVPIQGDVALML